MNEIQILRRKIVSKNQTIKNIRDERDTLKWLVSLKTQKKALEKQIGEPFDPTLFRKPDCIQALLDAEAEDRLHV